MSFTTTIPGTLQTCYTPNLVEAGLDEAGRGCLAGPVVAAAVVLPKAYNHPLLNDSKQTTEETRNALAAEIKQAAICWAVGVVDNLVIDEINILQASIKAMHLAVEQLLVIPELLLVDGNYFRPYPFIPHQTVVGGDGKYTAIAAASILAKTHRDGLMRGLAQQHPHYSWHTNVGYGTAAHRRAIMEHGITAYHRRSFRLEYSADVLGRAGAEN